VGGIESELVWGRQYCRFIKIFFCEIKTLIKSVLARPIYGQPMNGQTIRRFKMAKKLVLALVLSGLVVGGAFAQNYAEERELGLAISLDLGSLFKGFVVSQDKAGVSDSYFALSPVVELSLGNYSIGVRGDLIFRTYDAGSYTTELSHIGIAALGRWYPLAIMHKLFVGTEIGYDVAEVKDASNQPTYEGLTFALRIGWKQLMGGLFLEPSLGYVLSKSNATVMPFLPTGWQIGLNFGLAF
jgi:hypothetical protein